MTGLGRNVRFMMGIFHECLILMGVIFLFTFTMLNIGKEDPLTKMIEEGPFYLLICVAILIMIATAFGEAYCPTMVSFGSARKPAAVGMLLSQHIFMLEQLVVLFILAVLIESSKSMLAIRICPLGTAALLVLILGIGNLFSAISIKGHKVFAGIAGGVLASSVTIFAFVMASMCDFNINVEVFRPYNSFWLLLAGLTVDLAGAVLYYKAVTKADLKLA